MTATATADDVTANATAEDDAKHYSRWESAQKMAEDRGLAIVLPRPFEVFVDIDREEDVQQLRWGEEKLTEQTGCRMSLRPSPSGAPGHYHAIVRFPHNEFKDMERIAVQAALRSDPKREVLGIKRIWYGTKHPSLFFEKPEVAEEIAASYSCSAPTSRMPSRSTRPSITLGAMSERRGPRSSTASGGSPKGGEGREEAPSAVVCGRLFPSEVVRGEARTARARAVAAATSCRRCSECIGEKHHFSTEIRNAEGDMICKHCRAIGVECENCEDGLLVEETRIVCSNGCELQACESCCAFTPLDTMTADEEGCWFCGSCARSLAREANDGVPPTEMP